MVLVHRNFDQTIQLVNENTPNLLIFCCRADQMQSLDRIYDAIRASDRANLLSTATSESPEYRISFTSQTQTDTTSLPYESASDVVSDKNENSQSSNEYVLCVKCVCLFAFLLHGI